jgi:hypothetical protein
MSVIRWARTVRCDWPECTQQADVMLDEAWPDRTMPTGWLDLTQHLQCIDHFGSRLGELCPVHAASTFLAASMAWSTLAAARGVPAR